MKNIIQLKITLKGSKPPIWRRFQVHKTTTITGLHEVIQDVMGWENDHLFGFVINGIPFDERSSKTIGSQLKEVGQKFEYTYDFGDDWEHTILVEKIMEKTPDAKYPICLDGKGNCPPEDCGGIWGFYELMNTVKDKKHPEHEEMLEWLGEDYDPDFFDKDEVNRRLGV
jgi:hypothetical protein